jgi:hypothetical protein
VMYRVIPNISRECTGFIQQYHIAEDQSSITLL